jgi:hypothetical protein
LFARRRGRVRVWGAVRGAHGSACTYGQTSKRS